MVMTEVSVVYEVLLFVVVVVGPQLVCPSMPAPLRKSKQLVRECHRSGGLLMLCPNVHECGTVGHYVR